MPLYRFHVDVDAPPKVVAERLRSVVRSKPKFLLQAPKMAWWLRDPTSPPWTGSVRSTSFRLSSDLRYRNPLVPMVWGCITSSGLGARVFFKMFIHPLFALFVALWLVMAVSNPRVSRTAAWGVCIVAIALTAVCLFHEAIRARRLICKALSNQSVGVGEEAESNKNSDK